MMAKERIRAIASKASASSPTAKLALVPYSPFCFTFSLLFVSFRFVSFSIYFISCLFILDIDECNSTLYSNPCEEICENGKFPPGSFTCGCNDTAFGPSKGLPFYGATYCLRNGTHLDLLACHLVSITLFRMPFF